MPAFQSQSTARRGFRKRSAHKTEMALILNKVEFHYPAPGPSDIVRKAQEICGLRASFEEDESKLALHEFSGEVFFECAPNERIQIRAYKQGAVERFEEETGYPSHPSIPRPEGHYDKDGTQTIYVETYFGHEPTLFRIVDVALQRLGGKSKDGCGSSTEYDRNLTETELLERLGKTATLHKRSRPLYIVGGILMILTLPFHLLWAVLSMPFKLFSLFRRHPGVFRGSEREKE